MTDDDLIATYGWTRVLSLRNRAMLKYLLDDGRLPDAERATVAAFLQNPRNCSSLLITPNYGRVSLREFMAEVADATAPPLNRSWKFSDARHWSAVP
jgi:anti-sigma factor RsiW